jgi:alpha-D-xyloside xylohydrolase
LLPLGARSDRPDYDFLDGLTLALFALADGAEASAVIHDAHGVERARFTGTRHGSTVELRGTGGRDLKVELRGAARVFEGGSALETNGGLTRVSWPDGQKVLKLAT